MEIREELVSFDVAIGSYQSAMRKAVLENGAGREHGGSHGGDEAVLLGND
jgi:hypothetical protein